MTDATELDQDPGTVDRAEAARRLDPDLETVGRADVGKLIGRCLETVDNMRRKGELPEEIKLPSGAVRWFKSDIYAWLRKHQVKRGAA